MSRSQVSFRTLISGSVALLAVGAHLASQQPGAVYAPRVEAASGAAQDAIAAFQPQKGLAVELIAAEPMLANPVAFDLADDGRIYVVETHRLRAGVIDMRDYQSWVDEDLACRTVQDRVAVIQRHFGAELPAWRADHERIRCLIDDDRDGKIDRAVTFADGFNELADGIAAGVLADGADVWFTDIPNLWKLRDADRDGIADAGETVSTGYGVHFSLIGHDMHGAIIGPDRRLYFSIGDRGFHVEQDGKTFAHPNEGAVLRCELDGTQLEVVHRGLRNPQELAFDDFGDLFTGDNNSDGGDEARLVHIVEGGNSGWTIGYQWLPTRGAWNEDLLWKPRFDGQPAWVNAPIANVAHGPSGLVMNPGTGLPAKWNGRFFLCDFRGAASNSGVLALNVEQLGASHRLVDTEKFIWRVLATDCDFGPDGGLYVLDWVNGWGKTGRGRIYRVADPGIATDAVVKEVKELLRAGFRGRSPAELATLLSHADRRVREGAQFALVDAGAAGITELLRVAKSNESRLARLHAIWGLGTVARRFDLSQTNLIEAFALDTDAEIRAQAMHMIGDAPGSTSRLIAERALHDDSPRVRFFAAQALGKIGNPIAVGPLLALVHRNADDDAMLRHAAVHALSLLGIEDRTDTLTKERSPAVRRGAVLVLRRMKSPRLAEFLADPDPSISGEAARAIHDERIFGALPALASWIERKDLSDVKLIRRVLGAHRILGGGERLEQVLRYANRGDAPESMRVEALKIVAEWPRPHGQDRVLGEWRPLRERPAIVARVHIGLTLGQLSAEKETPDSVLVACIDAAVRLEAVDAAATLALLSADSARGAETRAAALRGLATLAELKTRVAAARAILPDAPLPVRRAARDILAKDEPSAVIPLLASLARDGDLAERRAALSNLAHASDASADAVLEAEFARLRHGELQKELRLDVLEACLSRASGKAREAADAWLAEAGANADALAPFAACLDGGNAKAGEQTFKQHAAAQCMRCHAINKEGGAAGPPLDGIGKTRTREYLLAALVAPQRDIAAGFAQVIAKRDDGTTLGGILVRESAEELVLLDPDSKEQAIDKRHIVERNQGGSSMPEMGKVLSRVELRDLVEFLATRDR